LPLYAYRCTVCGHRFEKIQNFSAQPELECPKCQGLLERPLTAPGLSFKGAGWYVNDYAHKNSSAPSSSEPLESSAKVTTPPCGASSTCAACPAVASAAASATSTPGS